MSPTFISGICRLPPSLPLPLSFVPYSLHQLSLFLSVAKHLLAFQRVSFRLYEFLLFFTLNFFNLNCRYFLLS